MALCEIAQDTKLNTLAHQVGERIRAFRKLRGLTLAQLAKQCGTTPQTIQRFEAANMTLSVAWIEAICTALDIEPLHLFDDGRFDREQTYLAAQEEGRLLLARCENFIARLNEFLEQPDG